MKKIGGAASTAKYEADIKINEFAWRVRRAIRWALLIVAFAAANFGGGIYATLTVGIPHAHAVYSAAKLVDGEARGEPPRGQKAAFATILARVEGDRFPNTFHGVIYQPYPRNADLLQYNAVGDSIHEDLSTEVGQQILWRTLFWYAEYQLGIFSAPKEARGAHSYCTQAACERQIGYFGRWERIGQIGNHVFYGGSAQPASNRPVSALAPKTSPRPRRPQSPALHQEIESVVATLAAD